MALATLPTAAVSYDDLAPLLIPAARHAGLDWLHHIVAVAARPVAHLDRPATGTTRDPGDVRIHIDLLVLTVRQVRHV